MQPVVEQEGVSARDIYQRCIANNVFDLPLCHQLGVDLDQPPQIPECLFIESLPALRIQRCQRQIGDDRLILLLQIGTAGFNHVMQIVLPGR